MPKSARAAAAVAANPEKSSRAIAKELGVHPSTVDEARKQLPDDPAVNTTGLDGKKRKVPEPKQDTPEASAEARKAEYAAADGAVTEPKPHEDEDDLGVIVDPYGKDAPEYVKHLERENKRLRKRIQDAPLPKEGEATVTFNDWSEAVDRVYKLEERNQTLSAALDAKEAQASRNWPADMKPKHVKKRDRLLALLWQISANCGCDGIPKSVFR